MNPVLTDSDTKKIQRAINKKYKRVAKNPAGLFSYPTGRAGLEALQYPPERIKSLPEAVTESYCGVGNPFALGPLNQGEAVLDIGCGAGVDALLAAMEIGPTGSVTGIDIVTEMLKGAQANLALTDLQNVTFEQAAAENLPFANQNFNVVISNGAFNLVPDKSKAFSEAYRVLKPAGRLIIADQILIAELPKEKNEIIKSWSH